MCQFCEIPFKIMDLKICEALHNFSVTMIAPEPSVVHLGTEDIREYENAKKSWPKVKRDVKTGEKDNSSKRKEQHERIGLTAPFGQKIN